MSRLYETLESMKDEITVQVHFNECWDETIFLTQRELEEWFEEIQSIINDETMSIQKRMQKVVDNITAE